MVFKRPRSPYWYLGPLKAGAVDVPRLSTKVRDKKVARAMESMLHELAVSGSDDLVRQVAEKRLSLIELYTARLKGSEALETLRSRANDPSLSDVVATFRPKAADPSIDTGLDQLLRYAPDGARLSWLCEPTNVTDLYARAMGDGRRANTVRRALHRAVADLLTHQIGRGAMLGVMADARVPSENDERRVLLTVDEVRKALEIADEPFRAVLGYALTTGIDRGPMLAQLIYHYDESAGTLFVPDTKAKDRERTLSLRGHPVLENAEYWLRQLVAGRKADQKLVPLTMRQIRTRWEDVRQKIGRDEVRWKDVRGIFATYYLLSGGEPRELQAIMGHSTMAMTLRYLRRLPAGNRERLKEHAKAFGMPGEYGHLSVQREAAS